jgi:hypothetical protein
MTMANTKSTTTALAPVQAKPADVGRFEIPPSPNVRTEQFDQSGRDLAVWLQIDLSASPNVRTERAMQAYNMATHHMVEAGLLLSSVHAEVGAEAFAAILEERGMAKQRASELMRGAALVARLPVEQREQVMALHKTKVVMLANASPAAQEAALDDEEIDLNLIGVRALRQRIKDLERGLKDTEVELETSEAEAVALKKQLKRGLPDRQDGIPHAIADLRAEVMVMQKRAGLAVDGLRAAGAELEEFLHVDAQHDAADATLRLAVAAVAAVRLQIDGVMARYLDMLPGRDPVPVTQSYLTPQELGETAERFKVLVAAEKLEKAQREWDRAKDRPQKVGRPTKRPGGEA